VRITPSKTLRLVLGLASLLAMSAPAFAATWIPGHYGPYGGWIRGHWVGGPGPAPGPYEGPPGPAAAGFHWVPGYYGPLGAWHRGHWVPN